MTVSTVDSEKRKNEPYWVGRASPPPPNKAVPGMHLPERTAVDASSIEYVQPVIEKAKPKRRQHLPVSR